MNAAVSMKDLIAQAKATEDQTEVVVGGDFEYVPPPAGQTVGRLVEYIELGKHVEIYEGKPKPAIEMVRITFEFTHPKNIKEIDVEGGKKKIADRKSITLPKKMNDKAKFYKLFMAMRYGREEITHMAEMLNEPFIFNVIHNITGEGDKKRTYAEVWDGKASTWQVFPPRVSDPLAGTVKDISTSIPELLSPLRIFLWSLPTKDTWDSLFIDGEREVKDDKGAVKKVSKNWLQEHILSATDYNGSALDQMLNKVDNLPTQGNTPSSQSTGTQVQAGALPGDEVASAATHSQMTAAPAEEQDALAALGF
jgi:hypothetical protein